MNITAMLQCNKELLQMIAENIRERKETHAIIFLNDLGILKNVIMPATPDNEDLEKIEKVIEDILVEKEDDLKELFLTFLPTLSEDSRASQLEILREIGKRLKDQEFFAPYFK